MALTNEDIQQVVNALKADAQGVGELAEATSLENVNSLPAIQTVGEEEQMVQVPISMLAAPAIAAAQIANAAADAANGAATEASQMAETAQQAASLAVEKATLAATAASEAQEASAQIDQLRSEKEDKASKQIISDVEYDALVASGEILPDVLYYTYEA